MKIAMVISSMSLGGASRVMSILANCWARRGDDVVIITLDMPEADAFVLHPAVRRVGLDLMGYSHGPVAALMNNQKRLRGLRHAIAASRAPVVLSFEDRTNVMVMFATLGMRVRQVICERTDVTRHRIGRLWPVLRRLSYPLATALVVQTRALVPWARSVMFGARRVHVLPNPVPMEAFASASRGARGHTLVSVGRLEPEKGYDVLLRAFARVAPEFPDWDLVIAGDGTQREPLAALVRALGLAGRARLAGHIAEPGTVLAEGAIFVMASRYEGFPNALLEAMASGLPVISTACVGSCELVAEGVSGILVPVEDDEALAAGLRRLISDEKLRDRFGRNALAAARRYALDSVIHEWDAVLA
jgi:glycosyltransferase involved in cell wall biosynthesis